MHIRIPTLACGFALAIGFIAGPTMATPARETPWLPEAAAYRLTLFLGNLAPVPWDEVERAWEEPYRGSEYTQGALDWLAGQSSLPTEALTAAIAREDREAVFEAATRLVAARIDEELDAALAAESPAAAQQTVRTARELYRAIEDHLAAADPEEARALGRAWLELSSATGSTGVLGVGATEPDHEAMTAARVVISDYLAANYRVADFAPRTTLSAVPETIALSGRAVTLPATLPPGSDIFDQDPLPLLVLGFEEQGIDETDLPLIAYGDMLFDSPEIFSGPARELGIALLDLPQPFGHQPAVLHPRCQPQPRLGGCGRDLLQPDVQRPPRRPDRHSQPARAAVYRPLWP